jgi:hypothetical protein
MGAPLRSQIAEFSRSRVAGLAARGLPWAVFGVFMLWAWGVRDLSRTLPSYGDSLEPVVVASWIADAPAAGRDPLVYPYNFFPEGWRIGSHSTGFLSYLALALIARIGGSVFAFNFFALFACLLAFAGTLFLARRFLPLLPSTFVALAFAFTGMRWHQPLMTGGLNILLGSAFLPWILWSVERARSSTRHRCAWLAAAGAFWALSFTCSLYFVYIGGIMLGVWMLVSRGDGRSLQRRLLDLGLVCAVFLLLGSPTLILNLHENAIAEGGFYDVTEVNYMGASLNSLLIPFIFHPWLSSIAAWIYRGPPFEQNSGNFGLLGGLAALIGAVFAWRLKEWRPAIALVLVCLVLSLGLTLHWNGETVQWSALRPLNQLLWQIGHAFKPSFFRDAQPKVPFVDAVPLPAYVLAFFMPFLERGRMFARYALAASLGVYLLAGLALARVRRPWVAVIVAGALIFEIVPPRLDVMPFPPANHPAYVWLSQQELSGEGIANVFAAHESTVVLAIFGYNLLAPSFHRQATAAGAAGDTPAHTIYLNNWLATHQHPFWQPDFAAIFRSYGIRYVLLEMKGEWEKGLWEEAQVADQVKPVRCFPKPEGVAPWSWPICVLEVSPSRWPDLNLLLHDGWSGKEDWGVWAEGTESYAQWIATRKAPARLMLSVFPLCMPGQTQEIRLDFNGSSVVTHEWSDCEPWDTSVEIPSEQVRVGENDLVLHTRYAATPTSTGNNSDARRLSVGFTKLSIAPAVADRNPNQR